MYKQPNLFNDGWFYFSVIYISLINHSKSVKTVFESSVFFSSFIKLILLLAWSFKMFYTITILKGTADNYFSEEYFPFLLVYSDAWWAHKSYQLQYCLFDSPFLYLLESGWNLTEKSWKNIDFDFSIYFEASNFPLSNDIYYICAYDNKFHLVFIYWS